MQTDCHQRNQKEKNDEKETASYRCGVHFAANQLWTGSRITNADG